jgi:prepilin-type N-terminal cleavage/methylation domain-containing protein
MTQARSAHSAAFTLIELLLVIAIVSIVVALALPALAQTRYSARSAVNLARLQQHAAVHALYAGDFRGSAVYPVDPARPIGHRLVSQSLTFGVHYFGVHTVWNIALADAYYSGQVMGTAFDSPFRSADQGHAFTTDFHYSKVFLAHPDFWNYFRRIGPSQWQATRLDQVRYPSAKALLYSTPHPGSVDWRFDGWSGSMAFTDGSARRTPTVLPGHPDGEGDWPGSLQANQMPAMHTVDGVFGLDTPP